MSVKKWGREFKRHRDFTKDGLQSSLPKISTTDEQVDAINRIVYLFYLWRGQFHHSHQLAWQKADCSKHHCTTEPMLWKNRLISTARRRLWEVSVYDRIAVNKPLLTKQNNFKRFLGSRLTMTGYNSSGIKSFGLKNQGSKSFRSNKRVYVRRRVIERAATLT